MQEDTIEDTCSLLSKWNLDHLADTFKAAKIDLVALAFLLNDNDTVKDLVPIPRDRIFFRKHLTEWVNKLSNVQTILAGNQRSDINDNKITFCDLEPQMPSMPFNDTSKSVSGVDETWLFNSTNGRKKSDTAGLETSTVILPTMTQPMQNDDTIPKISSENTCLENSTAEKERENIDTEAVFPVNPSTVLLSTTSPMQLGVNDDIQEITSEKNSSEYSTAGKKRKTYDLMSVLKASDDGLKALAMYKKEKKFVSDDHRHKVAKAIIVDEMHSDPSRKITHERFQFLAQQIVDLFPTEEVVLWFERYNEVRGGKKKWVSRGRLLWRYYNQRREYIEWGVLSKNDLEEANGEEGSIEDSSRASVEPNNEIQGAVLWLKENREITETLKENWAKTYMLRQNELKGLGDESPLLKYMKIYPALLEPSGYYLLEMDFQEKYPSSSMRLFEEWRLLSPFLKKEIKSKTPDFLSDAVYTSQEETLQILLNIATIFPVITLAKKKNRGKEKTTAVEGRKSWRPTKREVQDAFLLIAPSEVKLKETLEDKREALYSFGFQQQPLVAVIGTPEQPSQFLVVIDGFFYEVPSVMKAVDVAFKIYFALQAHYPPESHHIWLFLQKFVYQITTRLDKRISGVMELGNKYELFKEQVTKT